VKKFSIDPIERDEVSELAKIRARIDLSPSYQRQADVWGTGKRQLFIDSLLNGFDIPKLYFHDGKDKKKGARYAVVDGKQRLGAIWSFLDDELALADDFEWLQNESVRAAGCRYSQLPPKLQGTFDNYRLPIEVISTDDLEWVEELFSRLNEAVALNAPERRNALGGPLPPIIRRLPSERLFFTDRLPFPNNRYKHYDLVTKFLFLEHVGGPQETKRSTLDGFVRDFKARSAVSDAAKLEAKTTKVLERLEDVFGEADSLLSSLGLVVIYYLLERDKVLSGVDECRDALAGFDELRRQVRAIMRAAATGAAARVQLDPELVEFERLSQSPNDIAAMEKRMAVVTKYVTSPQLSKRKLKELK
jgi:hypothetical protein